MLWIALHLPALSLESFAATLGTLQHALPLALLQAQRIAAANRVALQLGVKPGLKRATALALAPQLRFGQADAARDAQALRAVAHAALAFTPMVTLDADAALPCVLLEVHGQPALLRRPAVAAAAAARRPGAAGPQRSHWPARPPRWARRCWRAGAAASSSARRSMT